MLYLVEHKVVHAGEKGVEKRQGGPLKIVANKYCAPINLVARVGVESSQHTLIMLTLPMA